MQILTKFFRCASVGVAVVLACVLGCSGGSSSGDPGGTSTVAQKLVYSDPSGTGYRLVREASSTDSHLVLALVGPSGNQIRGCVFSLSVDDTKAAWASAGGSDTHIKEGSVLALGSGTRLLKSSVSGQTLEAAIYQKGSTPAATLGSEAILSVALDLQAGATKGAIALSSPAAQILDAVGTTQTVTVSVGGLSAE